MLYQHDKEQFKQVRNQFQLEMELLNNNNKNVEAKFVVLKQTFEQITKVRFDSLKSISYLKILFWRSINIKMRTVLFELIISNIQ